jgi:glycosyltransferase involved in cell wall biosynthesis
MASWTGVGRYTVGLARALAARGDIDLIQVAAHDERPPVAPHQGARSLTAAKHPFSLAGARELGRMIRTVSPDVMHCAHFPTPMPASHPLVVTLHDLSPLLVPGIMPSLPKRLAYRYWNGRAAKIADRICVPSQFTASELTRLFPVGDHRTDSGRSEERRNARPRGTNTFGKSSLGNEVELHSSVQHHLFEQLVFADVGSDVLLDLSVREQEAHAEAVNARVVADRGQVLRALRGERANQVFGHPAKAKPADHDGGAVEYILNRLFSAGNDLVHSDVILNENRVSQAIAEVRLQR